MVKGWATELTMLNLFKDSLKLKKNHLSRKWGPAQVCKWGAGTACFADPPPHL